MAVGWSYGNHRFNDDDEDEDAVSSSSASAASESSGKWSEASRNHRQQYYHSPRKHHHQLPHRLLQQAHYSDHPADLIKMVLVSAALEKSAKSQELGGDSAMDRMKKILGSPMTKRRTMVPATPAGQARYFGVPLEEITRREGSYIPHLVTRVCNYIKNHGLAQEGIFRVNGNSRVVERLKTSFDRSGDADLEEAGDVMAVAGMLKLYLRELPDPVVPEHLTHKFVTAQNESGHSVAEVLERLRVLLGKLPTVNYQLLKYLSRFLVLVSINQNLNKMSPMALGIVFGPNLFRCSGGMDGLRQQGTTNQITLHFILKFDHLFLEEGEVSPYVNHSLLDERKNKVAPPRPPPPNLESQHPTPLPRKSRQRGAENAKNLGQESDNSSTTPRTPRLSDEEFESIRSASPFVLDSDRSEAGSVSLASPLIPSISNETVEKTISTSISQHLFGEPNDSLSSEEQNQQPEVAPVPAPRNRRDKVEFFDDLDDDDDRGKENRPLEDQRTSVKDRIHLFEAEDSHSPSTSPNHPKPKKQRPKSQAFELFETQGIIIGMAPENLRRGSREEDSGFLGVELPDAEQGSPSLHVDLPRPDVRGEETSSDEEKPSSPERDMPELDPVSASNPPLTSFKRPAGPKNRRTPSRHSMRQVQADEEEADGIVTPERQESVEGDDMEVIDVGEDVNHNHAKPSIRFLDLHHHSNGSYTDDLQSPDRQHPLTNSKPYVPPLDLSILHEHGDGSDPIPAEQGLSLAILHKAKTGANNDDVILSPRNSKIKKKTNLVSNPDEAPSPPKMQFLFTLSNMGMNIQDEYMATIKQLTKRIQSCKKKIKAFEESFEDDYGYRPSQSDKASHPEIKKLMQQLAISRKELKRVKERLQELNEQLSDGGAGEISPNWDSPAHRPLQDEDFQTPTVEDTLDLLMRKLREKQEESNRPSDLEAMNRDQVQDEKLAVQKTLLQYESIHGRPSSDSAKKLMKPLYDRYRTIKRMLAKPLSPREKRVDLPPVPEDHPIEFTTEDSKTSTLEKQIPTLVSPQETDFTVTQNLGLLTKETLRPLDGNAQHDTSADGPQHWKANLHELTVPQLLDEQSRARNDKKRLRRVLREFEDDFYQHTGRKVQKDDRAPMEAEYHEYKQIKARLKLLDALLVKYEPAL